MKKTEIRSYDMTRARLGIEGRRIQSELVFRLGGQAASIRTVYRWIERLKQTGDCTDYKYRVGRHRTGTSQAKITRVQTCSKVKKIQVKVQVKSNK